MKKEESEQYKEILSLMVEKIKLSKHGYYYSWWLRLDFQNKYSTTKINYELKKASNNGVIVWASYHNGVEYRLKIN